MNTYDVAIIGSGVAGSVTALILAKLGYKTLLVERDKHPRFALGESSTPIMSKKIRTLGMVYDIPEFIELASYDNIMASDKPLLCGPKELFHYHVHKPNQQPEAVGGDYPEIIVQTPDVDTQFLRAALDERMVEYAKKYGAEYVDMTELQDFEFGSDGVRMTLCGTDKEPYQVSAKFFIDGTGFRSLLSKKLDLRIPDNELDTPLRSRCIFTHFETVGRVEDAMGNDPAFNSRLKVDRIRATQHHCFDGGWYWFIPFDNGVTSVGINLDMDKFPVNDMSGEEEFWHFTNQFPVVKAMLENRKTLMPYIKTGRIQFRTKQAAGDRWALLPAAAIGMDAWFSTGLGLNLVSIHRLVEALHNKILPHSDFKREHLKHYEDSLFTEWYYITRMINGIYKSFKHFDVFKSYCFMCFMGAESYVHSGGLKRPNDPEALVLNVGNKEFIKHFEKIYSNVLECNQKDEISHDEVEFFRSYLQSEMRDFNYRDYGNPIHKGIHYRVSKDSPYYEAS